MGEAKGSGVKKISGSYVFYAKIAKSGPTFVITIPKEIQLVMDHKPKAGQIIRVSITRDY